MNSIGETLRLLRQERDFTLKTLSEGIISFSHLSKFEKGECDITLSNFILLTERLNISIDELLYFSNGESIHYIELLQKVYIAYSNNDYLTLQSYVQDEEKLYEQTGNLYHKYNYIMVLAIASDINPSVNISKNNIDFLVDYIVKCSFWTTYEVTLIGNTLTIYTEELLFIILDEMKSRLEEHKATKRDIRTLISLIENACIVLLRDNNFKSAKSLSNFLVSFIEPSYFFEKTMKLFIDGVILILEGKKIEGLNQTNQAIKILTILDEKLAADYILELAKFNH